MSQFNEFDAELAAETAYGMSEADYADMSEYDDEPDESMDGDFDSGMASAGYGTDEDYGYYDYDGMDYDFDMHTEGY